MADDGKTPLFAAFDGRLATIIAAADAIKASAPDAIQALHGFAAAAMTLSSVFVLGNALRLRRFRPLAGSENAQARKHDHWRRDGLTTNI